MPKTRDNYQVIGNTPQELVRSLNFLFQRLADRIDKIEGIRGTASIESDLEMNSNRVRELAAGVASTDAARVADADLPATLDAIGGLAFAANQIPLFTGPAAAMAVPFTPAGQAITAVETVPEQRTALDVPGRTTTEQITGTWTFTLSVRSNTGFRVYDADNTLIHSMELS